MGLDIYLYPQAADESYPWVRHEYVPSEVIERDGSCQISWSA